MRQAEALGLATLFAMAGACAAATTSVRTVANLVQDSAHENAEISLEAAPQVLLQQCTDPSLCQHGDADQALTITVLWERAADVDLILVQPSGEVVEASVPGLEVERGRGDCDAGGTMRESIQMRPEALQEGPYLVELRHTASCGVEGDIAATVVVRAYGEAPARAEVTLAPGAQKSLMVLTVSR